MEITGNVFQVGGAAFSSDSDCCVYLIKGNKASFLIDTGTGEFSSLIEKNITDCGVELKNISKIFLTHCHYDHAGGAEHFRKITGAEIVVHKKDAVFLKAGDNTVTAASFYNMRMEPLIADLVIDKENYNFDFGDISIKMIHTPGHTPGSVVYLTNFENKKILFGQDIHGPLLEEFRSNPDQYKKSLKKIIKIEPDILCEGHFGIYYGKSKIKKFISGFIP